VHIILITTLLDQRYIATTNKIRLKKTHLTSSEPKLELGTVTKKTEQATRFFKKKWAKKIDA